MSAKFKLVPSRVIEVPKPNFLWIAERLCDYRIQVDLNGALGAGGESMSRNHIVCLLRKDYLAAFPELKTKEVSDHILATLTKLFEVAKIKLNTVEPGHYEE